MLTRTSHRWAVKPGNFDRTHVLQTFYSDNEWGIPVIEKCVYVPTWLCPFNVRNNPPRRLDDATFHYFLDDYRFEVVWSKPEASVPIMLKVAASLSPDFSVLPNAPPAVKLWNTYRNRWMGAFWQHSNVKVIPSIEIGAVTSHPWILAGIEPGGAVAISVSGLLNPTLRHASQMGIGEVCRKLKPKVLVAYGECKLPPLPRGIEVVQYPSFWQSIRMARKCVQPVEQTVLGRLIQKGDLQPAAEAGVGEQAGDDHARGEC